MFNDECKKCGGIFPGSPMGNSGIPFCKCGKGPKVSGQLMYLLGCFDTCIADTCETRSFDSLLRVYDIGDRIMRLGGATQVVSIRPGNSIPFGDLWTNVRGPAILALNAMIEEGGSGNLWLRTYADIEGVCDGWNASEGTQLCMAVLRIAAVYDDILLEDARTVSFKFLEDVTVLMGMCAAQLMDWHTYAVQRVEHEPLEAQPYNVRCMLRSMLQLPQWAAENADDEMKWIDAPSRALIKLITEGPGTKD